MGWRALGVGWQWVGHGIGWRSDADWAWIRCGLSVYFFGVWVGLGVDLDGVVCNMMVYVPALWVCALSKIREIQVCFTLLDYFWMLSPGH